MQWNLDINFLKKSVVGRNVCSVCYLLSECISPIVTKCPFFSLCCNRRIRVQLHNFLKYLSTVKNRKKHKPKHILLLLMSNIYFIKIVTKWCHLFPDEAPSCKHVLLVWIENCSFSYLILAVSSQFSTIAQTCMLIS